ncbi:hypothetical protein M1555_03105 [Patescibacteria group bacterium]|nr:hypothetical protein [Patescibacteria group bacterium]
MRVLPKLFPVFIFLFVAFSLTPTVYELANRDNIPEGRSFELVHNFPTDYNFYLSRIREGIEGRVTVVEKYTSEPHKGSFIQEFYLFLGWLGRWDRVPWERSGDIYQVARIVLGVTLLFLIAEFARRAFSETEEKTDGKDAIWPLLAFVFAVTASTWPTLVWVNGVPRFGGYMAWWSVMDSLQRITFIPHLLAGQGLLLAIILAFSSDAVLAKPGNWIFLGFLGLLLGVIFPPGLVFVYAALAVLLLIRFVWDRPKNNLWMSWAMRYKLPVLVFGVLSVGALLYLQLMTRMYPWKRLVEVDVIRPLPFDYFEYIKAMGPVLPLGLLGLFVCFVEKSKTMLAATAWVIAWLGLLVIFHFVPAQSPLRFSEMIPHVPLAILTTYLFYYLCRVAPVARKNVDPASKLDSAGLSEAGQNFVGSLQRAMYPISRVLLVLPVLLVLLNLAIMYSSWLWQRDFIDHKMRGAYPLVQVGAYVMYPLKDFLSPMKFLQDHTARTDVILSEFTAGNYIPVVSGNTVYIGHDNTVHLEEKKEEVKRFFSLSLNAGEGEAWLKANNLHYIYYGPEEEDDASPGVLFGGPVGVPDLSVHYPFLKQIYENPSVRIYQAE